MTEAYKVLYDYAMSLIGDTIQARKIVNHAILEGATVAIEDKDVEKAHELIVGTINEMCVKWKERQKH